MNLSIVIPTKGRNEFILKTVSELLLLDLTSTEIVIQDNNESDEISEHFLEDIENGRVVYNNNPVSLSFVDNFEEAVSLASGVFVTVIGDDDFINPEIIDILEIAKENDIEAIIPANCLYYLWPDSGIKHKNIDNLKVGNGLFSIKEFSGSITKVDPRQELEKLLAKGGLNYLDTMMPKLYHGIVSRKLLDTIRDKECRLFEGLTPDIYISCLISVYAKNVYHFDYPLTIPGGCRKSGSVASSTGGHVGKLEDAPHFKNRGEYSWSKLVPAFYSVETIWADSAFAAVKKSDPKLYQTIDTTLLDGICYYKYKDYREQILVSKNIDLNKSSLAYFKYYFETLLKKISNKIAVMIGLKKVVQYEVSGIEETLSCFSSFNTSKKATDMFKPW
ncbi:glycosyltransferase [Vibrio breoganii]|uniref:glycosyltransferase n=1 Tax=Vibrio breoganii TaxID=553239 RepID=UPI0002E1A4F3|nr:glycosyltransferase [Vibrio breoganii]OED98590.1 hypothetical protein A1QE_00980 [Vibrio breoganii ZF-55]